MIYPGFGGGLFVWLILITIGVIYFLNNKNKNMSNNNQSGAGQPLQPAPGAGRSNVLAAPNAQPNVVVPKKPKYSALSVFMAVVLFGILVMFGERLIFDLNRYVNPVIDDEYTQWKNQQSQQPMNMRRGIDNDTLKSPVNRSYTMTQDSVSAVSQTKIYYSATEKGRYLMYKLIIHAALVIPVFVLAFVLFYFKRKKTQLKPLLVSFLCFAFWMIFHLLGETIAFVMNEYRNIAIYVILIALGIVFGGVTYFSQAKLHKEEN